jgi:murein DD-endopeptidase MepM/ murein hydrolase activator NlpD
LNYHRKSSNPAMYIFLILFILLSIGGGYIYFSPLFEKNKPQINVKQHIFWNLKTPLSIDLEDESGIKYYKVVFQDGGKEIVLNQKVFNNVQTKVQINVTPPKLDMFYKGTNSKIYIEVVDNSKWNMLEGNKSVKNIDLTIDTKKPVANVLENSRYIQRGGSGVIIVEVKDENLEDAYISFNDEKKFKLLPFYKENYYVALIGWPIDFESFKRVNLVAVDKALNKTITKVPFYIQNKKIKTDRINLSAKFIQNVSKSVLEQSFEPVPETNLKDVFLYSNKELREKNVKTIEEVVLKSMQNSRVDDFDIKFFKRLRGSKTVAGFAERRHYYLDDEKINEAWHLGIDWASVRKAPVKVSNDGVVIFKEYLGIYGNTIIIDHGMGLGSLYAHTSAQSVEVGETVSKKQKIANTGATGAVFGDHLHFGILVQGVEVNPIEWMDAHWIKVRITDVLNAAKKQIDSSSKS